MLDIGAGSTELLAFWPRHVAPRWLSPHHPRRPTCTTWPYAVHSHASGTCDETCVRAPHRPSSPRLVPAPPSVPAHDLTAQGAERRARRDLGPHPRKLGVDHGRKTLNTSAPTGHTSPCRRFSIKPTSFARCIRAGRLLSSGYRLTPRAISVKYGCDVASHLSCAHI